MKVFLIITLIESRKSWRLHNELKKPSTLALAIASKDNLLNFPTTIVAMNLEK
jgi:hypothetical protein